MPDTAPLTADFHRVEVHPPGTPFTGLGTLAVGVITGFGADSYRLGLSAALKRLAS